MKIRSNTVGIKCILYDFGQVLVAAHKVLICRRLGRFSGKTPKYVQKAVAPLLHRVDMGEINGGEFVEGIRTLFGIGDYIPHEVIKAALLGSFEFSGRMRRLLHFLRDETHPDGFFVQGIVSNIGEIHWTEALATFPTLRLRSRGTTGVMDFHIASYLVHVTKPHREIFEMAFEEARERVKSFGGGDLTPGQCVFFDDLPKNIKGAAHFGLIARRVTGSKCAFGGGMDTYVSMASRLRQMGIALPPANYMPLCDRRKDRREIHPIKLNSSKIDID